jgi:hypothetical protein
MKNSLTYSMGLLTVVAAASLLIVAALENDNGTLNNTLLNNTTLGNTSLNYSASNDTALNATNATYFMIGDADSNESARNLSTGTKPIKDASKLGYIIQSTPHGKV